MNVHLIEENWDEVIRIGWRFADWVRVLPSDHVQLMARPESVTPEEPILLGERLRWWSIAFMVGTGVAVAVRKTGVDGADAASQLRHAVEALEERCRRSETLADTDETHRLEHGWNRFQLARTCGYAAQGMLHLQEYQESVQLYEHRHSVTISSSRKRFGWLGPMLAAT